MAVGKGSLNRVVAKTKKSEIVTLLPNNVVDVEISAIKFSEVKDNALMEESVKAYGVILPVIVEESVDGLKLVDGAKRLTALKKLGINTVKTVVLKESGKILTELEKFEKPEKVVEKIVEKVVEKVVEKAPAKKSTKAKKETTKKKSA